MILRFEFHGARHSSASTSGPKYTYFDQSSIICSRTALHIAEVEGSYLVATILIHCLANLIVPSWRWIIEGPHDLALWFKDGMGSPRSNVAAIHEQFKVVPWCLWFCGSRYIVSQPKPRTLWEFSEMKIMDRGSQNSPGCDGI